MAEHPNVAIAREGFEAFGHGDLEGYKSYFAEDAVWHVGGHHPLSGTYRGREALFEYFAKVRELTGGSLHVEPLSILADNHHLGVFARITAQREDKSLDMVLAQAFRVNDDGKWSEYWAFPTDQPALDEFWS